MSERLSADCERVVVCMSGGIDSTVLVYDLRAQGAGHRWLTRCQKGPSAGGAAPRAEEGTYPAKSKRAIRDGESWWCRECLAERIAAVHADDCRCGGCRR